MAIRIRNSLDESVPSPHRLAVRIVERVVDDSTGEVVGKYRTSTADIENPDNVGVVLIGDGRVVDGVGVSVIPELGTRVLEMDTLPNGSVNVHPGHRVISVVT